MKKLGLRAVAGGLAVLMAVAGFAPATANAADVLTAKASKTLVITADMVDDDGEIVISGENWDRIIVEKEVNAKDIYFDGVEVGELVVESGGESNIQLWEVAAEQVTVKEPGLVELDINEIRALYADKETKAQAFELYMATRAANKNTLTKVPSIVTMEDAVVESLSVSGSVELNVAQGAVKAVTLEANAKVSQMDVTLNGYDGDVTYKGTEGFSVINLNSVNCAIENLKVEGTATNNYLNVESKNSTSANVEVAGNAGLSLNIPVAKLDVVAGATAAQVSVLSTVDELNVTASNASVNVGADAKVAAATIVGDKVSMSGEGKLTKVDITGKDASVSTSGTGIKGENTYRPPVVKEPAKPAVEFGTLPEGSLVFLPSETNMTGYGYTKEDMENGAVAVTINGQYQEIQFNLPKNVDLSLYDKLVATLESPDDSSANALCLKVITTDAGTDQYNNPVPIKEAWGVVKYPGGDVEVDLSGFDGKQVCRFTVMANNGACNVNVYRIAFIPKSGVTPPAGDDTPDAGDDDVTVELPELPENAVVYTMDQFTEFSKWDATPTISDGVLNVTYKQQWNEVRYSFPEDIDLADYESVIITAKTPSDATGKEISFKLYAKDAAEDEYGNPTAFVDANGFLSKDAAIVEISVADFANLTLNRIGFMAGQDSTEAAVTVYNVALVPKAGGNDTPDTPDEPEVPEEPEVVNSATLDLNNFVAQGNAQPVDINPDGSITVTFSTNYAGSYLPIPAEYADLKYVELSVASTKGGEALAGGNQIAFIDTEGQEITTKYSKGVITLVVPADKTLGKIVFNAQEVSADANQVMTIDYVKVAKIENMDLSTFNKGGASEMVQNADGTVTLTFGDAAYTGSGMVIPAEYANRTYFEVKAVAVDETGTIEKPGVQVLFLDTEGETLAGPFYTAWSGYVASCEVPEGKTLGQIIVNNQDTNVKLEVYYIAARY